jgi:hypothetical protein
LTSGHVQGSGSFPTTPGYTPLPDSNDTPSKGNKEYLKPVENTCDENFSGAMTPEGDTIFTNPVTGHSPGRLTGAGQQGTPVLRRRSWSTNVIPFFIRGKQEQRPFETRRESRQTFVERKRLDSGQAITSTG